MNIQCPKCETAYVVPDIKVGEKPKKMRCSRCQEVFTVKRRSNKTPLGYQEFTGGQEALPAEFAFLRADSADVHASTRPTPVPPPQTKQAPPPLPHRPGGDAVAGSGTTAGVGGDAGTSDNHALKTQPGFGDGLRAVTAPNGAGGATPPSSTTTSAGIGGAGLAAAKAPVAAAGGAASAKGAPQDIFGNSSWETEAPLDLENYAAPSDQSQKIGKIVAISIGVVVLLLVFVMFRNGWRLSLSELPAQFAFAFSGGERETFPDEVADLETTVSERRLLTAGARTYLLVTGTVFNNSPVRRSEIRLRGRLKDAGGDVRAEVKAPCDVILEDSVIKNTPPGQIGSLYNKRGVPYNCWIKGESRSVYQLVFETPPADYSQSFEVDVIPIFAK